MPVLANEYSLECFAHFLNLCIDQSEFKNELIM